MLLENHESQQVFVTFLHNKEKLCKKYLNQKTFLINNFLHEIFKRNRNIIKEPPTDTKTDYFSH